ncbi:MAG: type II/IV secretion system protein [Armatimonadetes bacterium]|nr:type II/IV secretion system protein [Armatimonadota bacterium]
MKTAAVNPNSLVQGGPRRIIRLGERLLSSGVITDQVLRQAVEKQKKSGGFIGEILVDMGAVSSQDIQEHLEESTGFPFFSITKNEVDKAVATQLPEAFVTSKKVLPFKEEDGQILMAMVDPLDITVIDEARALLQKPVRPYLALTTEVQEGIKAAFDVRHKTSGVIDEIVVDAPATDSFLETIEQMDQAPLVRLVNGIMDGAISANASDIHIEPMENNVRVRYRIDGVLYDQMTMPRTHLAACVSRIKVVSNLDIAERRRPQDGRMTYTAESGARFDVRVSIMGTVHGEKVCMRLLEKTNRLANLESIGFIQGQRAMFQKFVGRPHGLVLVTGPTGSGKSTTLYAGLQSINETTRNISTIEDPVEYALPGANQVQVNPKIDVTFATGLRTLVRQDPDVILVGEIRDPETADIAVQAALTGHLVLSSLHTNSAPGAVTRLLNMGVEPFLVSAALVGVVGQRLVRTVCAHCIETYLPTQEEMDILRSFGIEETNVNLTRGRGCKRCGNRGTKGRTAVMEMFSVSDELRRLILAGATGVELDQQVEREGFMSMRKVAGLKVLAGETTLEEVLRVFAADE